tara:strand:+ start:676 stop:927 length:252 start_codon:yes stop_codon:yes gene_type:complete
MYDYEIDENKTARLYLIEQTDPEAEPTRRLFLEQYGFTSKAKATEFAKSELAIWTQTAEDAKRYEEEAKAAAETAATEPEPAS